METNVLGTLNVLEACRDCRVGRLLCTSTSEVYGTARYTPIDEDHPLQAQSPYAATKIAADQLAESYHASFGLPVVIVRPFNTFGPRQSARAVIPTILAQALSGDRLALGSTGPVRDFLFVADNVRGFLAAAEAPGVEGEVLNLATAAGVTIGQVVELAGKLLGRTLQVHTRPEAPAAGQERSARTGRFRGEGRPADRLAGRREPGRRTGGHPGLGPRSPAPLPSRFLHDLGTRHAPRDVSPLAEREEYKENADASHPAGRR